MKTERDFEIFTKHAHGRSKEQLAAEYDLSLSRITAIVAKVRNRIPPVGVDELRQDLTIQLNEMRYIGSQLASDEEIDPGVRVKAIAGVERVANRLAGMYGMNSVQVNTTGTVVYQLEGMGTDDV
jgi:predicted ATP-grasp superfamily ATP-dependent carboligase